jgi:hypothetical protein
MAATAMLIEVALEQAQAPVFELTHHPARSRIDAAKKNVSTIFVRVFS